VWREPVAAGQTKDFRARAHLGPPVITSLEMKPDSLTTTSTSRNADDGFALLTVVGPATLATVFDFQNALRNSTSPKTIVDLSGVPYMDSAGLGALLVFHVSCSRNGRKYAIVGTASRIMTMIRVSKVDTVLSLFETTADAEEFLEG